MLVPPQSFVKKEDVLPFTLVVHGGAGDTRPRAHEEAVHRAGLRRALLAGNAVLRRGGSALDAVTVAVSTLESDRSFNAGAGAVFTTQGEIELEASIMTSAAPKPCTAVLDDDVEDDVKHEEEVTLRHASLPPIPAGLPDTRRCASASLIKNTQNPVQLVRALYLNPTQAPHTFFTGRAAEELGWRLGGSHQVPAAYFWTKKRWLQHRRELGLPDFDDEAHAEAAFAGLDITLDGKPPLYSNGVMPPQVAKTLAPPSYSTAYSEATPSLVNSTTPAATSTGVVTPPDSIATSDIVQQDLAALPRGTVGAVALDKYGVVACATSTGGKTNKLPGRLGDSAVPGSGFWAESWQAAVSKPALTETHEHEAKQSQNSLMRCLSSGGACGTITPPEINASVPSMEKLNVTQQPTAHDGIGSFAASSKTVQRSMALSATGDGDYFLRCSFASLVAHRCRFLGESLDTAAQRAIEEMGSLTGEGGCIAVDEHGTPVFHMNTATMNRGWIGSATNGTPKVAIWNDEECA